MDGISRSSASLIVKVITLYEHGMIAHAANPHITRLAVQHDSFTDVQSRSLAGISSVYVWESTQTESITSWRINIAIYGHLQNIGNRIYQRYMELLYQNMLTNNTNNILSRHLSTATFINRGFSTDILFFNNTHMNITCAYTYVWMHTCTHTHKHTQTHTSYRWKWWRYFEDLSNLCVHLKVCNCTPEIWSCNS